MSTAAPFADGSAEDANQFDLRRQRALAAAFAGVGALSLAVSVWQVSLVPVIVGCGLCSGLAMLRQPNLATLLAIFILYTNSADVAVTFHRVPYILGASFVGLWLIPLAFSLRQGEKLYIAPAIPWLIAYAAGLVVSSFRSPLPEQAVSGVVTFVVEGLLVFFLVSNVVRTRAILRASVWCLLLAGLCMGILPVYQQATRQFDNDFGGFAQTNLRGFQTGEHSVEGEVRQRRLSGPIGEQNRFAQHMLMLVPFGVCGFEIARRWPGKLLALAVLIVTFAAMAVAFSRGAAVAFVLLTAAGAATGYIRRSHLLGLAVTALIVLILMPQYLVRLSSIANLADLQGRHSQEKMDGAVHIRTSAIASSAVIFAEHPLLGLGPGVAQYFTREYGKRLGLAATWDAKKTPAHMIFLDVAADSGLVGLASLLAACGVTVVGLIRCRRRAQDDELRQITTAIALALGAYFACGLFLHFAFIRYFWLIMGLAAACQQVAARERSGDL